MDRYAKTHQIALAQSLRSRKKIYLDTCFWINVRNAVLLTTATTDERKLLHFLRRGVRAGRLTCPISESTFVEVMKQTDMTTRIATADLIDELSLGVSLTSGRVRTSTEIAHFFHALHNPSRELHELDELAWTKLSYALGYIHPIVAEFDAETELKMQIAVFDEIWNADLRAIATAIGSESGWRSHELADSAATINADIRAHQDKLVSYEQTYRDEVAGAADLYYSVLVDLITDEAAKAGHTSPDPGSPEWQTLAQGARGILVAALDDPGARQTLRSIHIQSALHAGLRWNKGTKFVANHFFDFEHATAALAYCDAFFTEAFLANLVNAGHLRLGELNGCRTTNNISEAIQLVTLLAQPHPSQ